MATTYRVIVSDEATEDVGEIVERYHQQGDKLAGRFFDEYVKTRDSLSTNPQRFREVFLFVRRAFITRFPYNVY